MQLSPRWRWKLRQYQNKLEQLQEQARDFFKAAAVKQKICPACRALVGANESRCPFCGESISAFNRIGVKRVTSGLTGGFTGGLASSLVPDITYTWTLVAINFIMFGISMVGAARAGAPLGGLMGIPGNTLFDLGSNYGPAVIYGQYWRLITGAFLHGNLIHLLFNIFVLADVGAAVEDMYGSTRFIVLYLWTLICGSLASFWWRYPFNNMVGASGAIFGLFGVMIAYGYRRRTGMAEQIRSMYTRWAIYGLVFGLLMPGVDNAAHLGGLAGGLLFGYFISDMPPVTRESIFLWRALNYLSWLVIAASFVFMGLFLKG